MSTTSSLFLSCGIPDWYIYLFIGITMLPMLPGALLGCVAIKKSSSHPNAKTWTKAAVGTFAAGLLVTLSIWFGWVDWSRVF